MAAYKNHNLQYASSALFLISLVLTAQAQNTINGVNVLGRVCCTPTGSCTPTAAGLVGVSLTLNCTNILTGSVIALGSGNTGLNGVFNFTVPILTPVLIPISSLACSVTSLLPLNNTVCPVLNTATGVLSGTVVYIGTTLSFISGLLGNLVNLFVTVFTII